MPEDILSYAGVERKFVDNWVGGYYSSLDMDLVEPVYTKMGGVRTLNDTSEDITDEDELYNTGGVPLETKTGRKYQFEVELKQDLNDDGQKVICTYDRPKLKGERTAAMQKIVFPDVTYEGKAYILDYVVNRGEANAKSTISYRIVYDGEPKITATAAGEFPDDY